MQKLIVGLSGALLAIATPAGADPAPANDRAQLEQLNARWLKSYETRDTAALASILADDFIGIYGEKAVSKPEMLATLEGQRNSVTMTWDGLRIDINNDTAVVSAISTRTVTEGQKQTVSRNRYADIYVRRGSEWKAIAAHVVRMGQ